MGAIKGGAAYSKFRQGKALSRGQAILAMCYVCNGQNEGGVDCLGRSCPLYQFMPYRADVARERKTKRLEKQSGGSGALSMVGVE